MKKVRFETPTKGLFSRMEDRECHSPRPFLQKMPSAPNYVPIFNQCESVINFTNDPIQRYNDSDSSPYPMARKTQLPTCDNFKDSSWSPSNELDLSMLDASSQEPRQPVYRPRLYQPRHLEDTMFSPKPVLTSKPAQSPVLSPLSVNENIDKCEPPNVLSKENSFFIRRDNLDKYHIGTNLLPSHNKLNMGKENHPVAMAKSKIITSTVSTMSPIVPQKITPPQNNFEDSLCRCHHCVRSPQIQTPDPYHKSRSPNNHPYPGTLNPGCHHCAPPPIIHKTCQCGHSQTASTPQIENAVDKKTWAIKKYEKSKQGECLEMSKQSNVTKEKREPTVADLFKIIKLQNEQLQLLQEKVDTFISVTNNSRPHSAPSIPVNNFVTEHVALQTIDQQHKISIGVMTSFEMVHTSTVINKEVLTRSTEAQIQCNRSQISIKEVVSKPSNVNVLEGLAPKRVTPDHTTSDDDDQNVVAHNDIVRQENVNDDKTLNEMSLYNVQVDNATTPMISPEQSMYLDVRDYSDSDSSGNTSPVGWTYYNKVMTRMNGMLEQSEMPSSASAMVRNTRQQFMQMHIDKTNVSVTKRVKFGDDVLGIHQPHIYSATTDTSLKMNQLAAKYLNLVPVEAPKPKPVITRPSAPIDMSIATRNYMERHKLLQGTPISSSPPNPKPDEMPRFLDMTAIKRQTKLL